MGRRKLALTFYFNENWIAGTYYVVNIIKALKTLPDDDKPALYILLKNQTGKEILTEIEYPFIKYININPNEDAWLSKYARRILIKFFKKDYIFIFRLSGVNQIFEGSEQFSFIKNHYFWIHDFQECRLPNFFTKEEAEKRSELPKRVSMMADATVILSSLDALNDFNTFFTGYLCKVKVLRFASSLPEYSATNFKDIASKYGIKHSFFICSNQFWQHKNHKLVLKAVRILNERNIDFQVVLTGKNYDHRNKDYYEELMEFVRLYKLEKRIIFCGFLDREVQLSIANNSLAYIQPSLFEGWSTTVEDAKNLNKYILLSDIPVHREQMDYNVSFFDPYDEFDLAKKIEHVLLTPPTVQKRNYLDNIKEFGQNLLKTFWA